MFDGLYDEGEVQNSHSRTVPPTYLGKIEAAVIGAPSCHGDAPLYWQW